MISDIFLSAFLGCLLALAMVAIAAWQIAIHVARKWFASKLPEIVHQALGVAATTPLDSPDIQEMVKAAGAVPPGVVPHTGRLRCACGTELAVPIEKDLPTFATAHGWQFDAEVFGGWGCPECNDEGAVASQR
jgi:hypothetical protein